MSYWLENNWEDPKHTIVDLGYLLSKRTQTRAEKLRVFIDKRNFELVGFGRLVVKIPPRLIKTILSKFRRIKTGKSYLGCTHYWLCKNSTDWKRYALKF